MDNLEKLWELVRPGAVDEITGLMEVDFNLDLEEFTEAFYAAIGDYHQVSDSYVVTPREAIELLEDSDVIWTYVCCLTPLSVMEADGTNCSVSVEFKIRGNTYALTMPGVSFYPVQDFEY
ncbi:hypothetical protein HOD38_03995 [archaeon]|jgi:hypothetical protein|nr:hypothetical protein [archaeon]MBT4440476.1 hypothetical protein [archaeon]